MKKVLFMLAAAALVLVSCEKEVSSITSISIDESVTLLAGTEEVYPLSLYWEPAEQQLDLTKVTWTSSDETVVTVDADGGLLALAAGNATVTAKFNDLTATCAVKVVDDARELIAWDGEVTLGGILGLVSKDPILVKGDDGSVDSCALALGVWYLQSEGVSIADGTGAGYVAEFLAPLYYIVSEDGYYGSRLGFEIVEDNPLTHYPTEINKNDIKYYGFSQGLTDINAYGNWIDSALIQDLVGYYYEDERDEDGDGYPDYNDTYNAYAATMPYGGIFYIDFEQGQWPNEGFLGAGYYAPANSYGIVPATNYDFSVAWLEGFYGLKVTDDGQDIVRPYEFAGVKEMRYSLGTAAGAPAHKAAPRTAPSKIKLAKQVKKMTVK